LIDLPTLDEFLEDENLHRSYVTEPGFSSLYLRKSIRYINSKPYENVLQIANCTAETPGDGAFTALIEKIELKWSGPIFIEQVLSERFAVGLLKLGFVPVNLEDQDFCGFPRHFVKKLPI
jgi:hypothetical protein